MSQSAKNKWGKLVSVPVLWVVNEPLLAGREEGVNAALCFTALSGYDVWVSGWTTVGLSGW